MAALTRIVENDEREINLACELLKAILPASASACQKLQVCVQMNKKKKALLAEQLRHKKSHVTVSFLYLESAAPHYEIARG